MRQAQIQAGLDALAAQDSDIRAALDRAGYPPERVRAHDFATMLRVIVGQQVSVAAAGSIWTRVAALMDGSPTPDALLTHSEETLRGAGLSRQKAVYARSLAQAVSTGALPLEALSSMDDDAVIAAITQVKGLGRWSAHMVLIASLGRPDIWPVDDIAVQEGVKMMIGLEERPKPKLLGEIGQRWRPYRSSVALLAWHYYGIVAL